MNEFMMIFRHEKSDKPQLSPEEMQAAMGEWQDWIGGIAAQGKFVATNPLETEGRTINEKGLVSDGPYAEVKEIVGGYLIVKADTLEEAMKMAEGCPNLKGGGTVEVRKVMKFEMPS